MGRNIPTVRAGTLILEPDTDGARVEIPAESDAWFAWLETARTFAFDDPGGRFTARKKRRWGVDYWYASRRRGGQLHETYLGKARNVTLGRLRLALATLNELAARTSPAPNALGLDARTVSSAGSQQDRSYSSVAGPPVPRSQLSQLVRTGAVDRIGQVIAYPLTLVSAPAGYGKTVLLAQWIATAPSVHAAWVTLDERDNDPVRFWARVSAALEGLYPGLFESGRPPARPSGSQAAGVMLNALIATLPAFSSPTVLILDDYHEIRADNTAVHEAIARLVEHLPAQAHVVLASRAVPPLPLAGLRTRNRLFELYTADLKFTLEETGVFLRRLMHLDLPDEAVEALHTRTEGWVAALQLAALSLQTQPDAAEWIASFSGENRYIFDYLVEEVVNHLSAGMRTFVLQTALLNRLSGPLCDAVTLSSDSQAMLEELERANLFLVPLDDRREWYRYHQLFADVLRRYLRRTQPGIVPDLYARASAWCEANGRALEAIDYAVAATAYEQAADLLEGFAPVALTTGYQALIRDKLERLPDDIVRERPHLCVIHAYTLLVTGGDRVVMRERVSEAEMAVARTAHLLKSSDLAILQGEVLALRTSVRHLLGEGSPREVIAALQQALATLPRHHAFRSFVTLFMGVEQMIDGDARKASRTLYSLLRESEARSDVFYVGVSILYLGLATLLLGRLDDVLDLCSRVSRLLAAYGDSDLMARIQLLRGRVSCERNDLDQALNLLGGGISLRYDPAPFLFEGFPTLAYAYLGLGNEAAAYHMIEVSLAEWTASQAENSMLWVWTGRLIRAHQARVWLLSGDVEAASTWVRELERYNEAEAASDGQPPTLVREWEGIVLAREYLAESRPRDALKLLDELGQSAEADGRIARLLEILVLRAAAYDVGGNTPASLQALERAVELGAPQRFVRTFVEGGPSILRLLTRLQAERTQPGARIHGRHEATVLQYVEHLIAACARRRQDHEPPRTRHPALVRAREGMFPSPTPKLTRREGQIMRLIASGATNKDIASELVISVATVKHHVSNILMVLGVRNRTQAVARARELGLPGFEALSGTGGNAGR